MIFYFESKNKIFNDFYAVSDFFRFLLFQFFVSATSECLLLIFFHAPTRRQHPQMCKTAGYCVGHRHRYYSLDTRNGRQLWNDGGCRRWSPWLWNAAGCGRLKQLFFVKWICLIKYHLPQLLLRQVIQLRLKRKWLVSNRLLTIQTYHIYINLQSIIIVSSNACLMTGQAG